MNSKQEKKINEKNFPFSAFLLTKFISIVNTIENKKKFFVSFLSMRTAVSISFLLLLLFFTLFDVLAHKLRRQKKKLKQ